MLELDVAPIDGTQPCKAFEQRFEVWHLLLWTTRMPEITNCGNFSALLRARREWPRNGSAAEQRDKRAASLEFGDRPVLSRFRIVRGYPLPTSQRRYSG